MRRVSTIIVCTMILQAVCASQAFAWWDGVEHASGPGPFFGWDIQLRLFCIVKKAGEETEIRSAGPVGAILSVCRMSKGNDAKTRDDTSKERERLMVDLGARFLRTKKYEKQAARGEIPDFADGKRIHLTTLEPAVMFPVVEKGYFRLDYGFGAGVYWLTSEAFEPVHGTLLEPIRLDFRLQWPYKVKPVARFGLLNFPAGFNFQDFLGAPGHDGRVSSDWVKSLSLFVDLTEVAAIWTEKLKR